MASGTVGSWQQGSFTSPVNGQSGDASVVLGNDNATVAKHNSHDNDATIHVQSSVLASRPGFGTAQRVWVTTDGLRAYVDSGSAWNELAYLPLAGGTVTGAVTFSSTVTANITGNVSGSSGSCTGNAATATSASACSGLAATATALATPRTINGVAFDGTANITITVSSLDANNLTGTTLHSSVVTSSLTTVGALTAGSIGSGFGAINIGTNPITAGKVTLADGDGSAKITTTIITVASGATHVIATGAGPTGGGGSGANVLILVGKSTASSTLGWFTTILGGVIGPLFANTDYTHTLGSSNATNVSASGADIVLQNNTAGSIDYTVTIIGGPF
jgi:hypothetical protein